MSLDRKRVRSRYGPHRDKPRPTLFARWLTQWRLEKGLRQADLAAVVGIHSGRIAELECGRRQPSPELADQLHRALGEAVPPPPWPPNQR